MYIARDQVHTQHKCTERGGGSECMATLGQLQDKELYTGDQYYRSPNKDPAGARYTSIVRFPW